LATRYAGKDTTTPISGAYQDFNRSGSAGKYVSHEEMQRSFPLGRPKISSKMGDFLYYYFWLYAVSPLTTVESFEPEMPVIG
jgi:hypothetical protein